MRNINIITKKDYFISKYIECGKGDYNDAIKKWNYYLRDKRYLSEIEDDDDYEDEEAQFYEDYKWFYKDND